MAGLETRPRHRMTQSTSPWCESSPCSLAITSYPSARNGPITLLKHEPSAQRPWQKTMLGLLCADIDSSFRGEPTEVGIAASLRRRPPRCIAGSCDLLGRGRRVVLVRDPREREARVDVELGEDASQMARDGVRGHEQLLGDLAVGETLGDEARDGELGVGHGRPAVLGAPARDEAAPDAM